MSISLPPQREAAPRARLEPDADSPAWLGRLVSFTVAVGLLAGVAAFGYWHGWKMPKFCALVGASSGPADDWCADHGVPESICVECRAEKANPFGWCKTHGIHECPLCHPEVAQLTSPSRPADALFVHFEAAEAVGERVANNPKCTLNHRRLQFTSDDAARRAGVQVGTVGTGHVVEAVEAPGEVEYDPTTVARVSARLAGTVDRVEKHLGERVRRGDILAFVDAPAVAQARADLAQARLRYETERRTAASLQPIAGTLPERRLREARAAFDEATIQVAAAEQVLANLGVRPDGPAQLPVVAPCDGMVLRRTANVGEAAEPGKVLFVLAEPERLTVLLRAKMEDAPRLKVDLPVRFTADGGISGSGQIAWIGTAIDERSRTVPVRVALDRRDAGLRAGLFGTGRVVLRESEAVVVPGEAVHWEGCCHVVFVRDRRYGEPDAAALFHTRTVLPGVAMAGRVEILAGVLPGEVIATAGSGVLRSELLRNHLGAG